MGDLENTGQGQSAPEAVSGQGQAPPPAPPASAAEVSPAGATEAQALQTTLTEREANLEEQRRIQAGLDRRIGELGDDKVKLEAEVKRLSEVALSGDSTVATYEKELGDTRAELATAARQVEVLQQQLEAKGQANERLRIMASEFADLAPLLEVDALPKAATIDEFRQKLTTLSERFVPAAQAKAYARAQGARPPASPPASPAASPDALLEEIQAATKAGEIDRLHELQERWYAVADDFPK